MTTTTVKDKKVLEVRQLSGQITYTPPPNHSKYIIMGGYNGKDPNKPCYRSAAIKKLCQRNYASYLPNRNNIAIKLCNGVHFGFVGIL